MSSAQSITSKKVLTVTNESYITATDVCEMLHQISAEYAGKTVHLVLDNARYQKCATVPELAGRLGIGLYYIPPYSPNLNLIERLWKFIKGELRSKYYDDFGIFRQRIDSIVASASAENKARVSRLIGQKVQLFDELAPICPNTLVAKNNWVKELSHSWLSNSFCSPDNLFRLVQTPEPPL